MHLLVCLVLVLGTPSTHTADRKRPTYPEISGGNKLPNIRWPRSGPAIAKPAIKALINSAVEVPSLATTFRKMMKQGRVSDAIADFKNLKPTFVTKRWFSADGFVGDVEVKLQYKDLVYSRRPSITILDSSGAKPITIVYVQYPVKGKLP